jgi:hypothetical protein
MTNLPGQGRQRIKTPRFFSAVKSSLARNLWEIGAARQRLKIKGAHLLLGTAPSAVPHASALSSIA